MGLIKAAAGAIGSTLKDQWKEAPPNIVVTSIETRKSPRMRNFIFLYFFTNVYNCILCQTSQDDSTSEIVGICGLLALRPILRTR